ncbi:endonuclease/exonuclease/phosphatase family protein [Sinomicrobium soli]|uniref:endonuclease/exonuclease/phosphatase family protein n=1 Tax=Sinomicrobium sp. N-1-3-6 TaxID=2219864 RepID=UPI00137502A0|nr:endonuclease/exonuclease/phosphatase family protein [Sinomicrobium sp. N-1-3-6]
MKSTMYYLFISLIMTVLTGCKSDDDQTVQNPEVVSEGVMIKAMSYNIYSGQLKGIPAIAEVINKADPDIVGLQEVESVSGKVPFDVVDRFLELTDMEYAYYARTHDLNPGEYGNLILSKYPVKKGVTHQLGVLVEEGSYPRVIGIVEVEKEGKTFYFADTHLDHLSDDTNRNHQVGKILEYTSGLDAPMIMAGDFNALQGSDPLNSLLQTFTLGCIEGNCGLTTGTPQPSKAIDYLMYAPEGRITPVEYGVFYDAFSESDHFPVVATFVMHDSQ